MSKARELQVQTLLSEEPETIAQFRRWRNEVLNAVTEREGGLIKKYMALVPEDLQPLFAEETSILPNLVEYGRASRKYREGSGDIYGYPDLATLRRWFRSLAEQWKGHITIGIFRDGDRIEVVFTVVG